MPQTSSQKQQPLIIAFFAMVILIAGIIYTRYFQQAPLDVTSLFPPSTSPAAVPQLPNDLFRDNAFLNLQTYQPVVAPEPSARPNPFAAP